MIRRALMLAAVVFGVAFAASAQTPNNFNQVTWNQWGENPQHTGEVSVAGQAAHRMLQDVVYDPFVAQEQADPLSTPDLLVHYQAPLIDGDNVYMEFKSGTFTTHDHWETQIWNEKRLHWENGSLVTKWSFQSDWKPAPFSLLANGPYWQPVFHAVFAGSNVYVPGAGGSIYKLDKLSGALIAHIAPLGNDADTFLGGPPAVDAAGNVYYHASKFVHGNAWASDVVNSWLVKVSPNGTTHFVNYASLNPGAPAGNAKCSYIFNDNQLPWPPSPDAVPPTATCGTQRPGLNSGIGIAPDGTVYTVTTAHFIDRTSYLLAVNPNLTTKWVASMRDRFNDGCNVIEPPNGTPGGCRVGSHTGVDPSQNRPGAGRVIDDSSATPTVAPDGAILYGAYTRYNYFQGHLMKFSSTGQYLGGWPFGWDMTPNIYTHNNTYSIVFKENHYGDSGSYCDDENFCPSDRSTNPAYPEAYFITQLSKNLNLQWQYQNTNDLSCTRNPDGTVSCVSDHPNGFEWCVNGAVVDKNGVVYVNSEDGGLYAINQGGGLRDHLFLNLAIGAAYTPLSMDGNGKIYTQNDGHLFVVGN
ncbi:MAG TPA: hypothetical protein VFE33_19455 [Thermoanaerobaculia bacterium]|nr:hypothetical protein [Thermoanaerobaculia bacterium]